jgi:hypothetical protein
MKLAEGPYVLVVNPSLKAASVAELVALAREKPGSIDYASSGGVWRVHARRAREVGQGRARHRGCCELKRREEIRKTEGENSELQVSKFRTHSACERAFLVGVVRRLFVVGHPAIACPANVPGADLLRRGIQNAGRHR